MEHYNRDFNKLFDSPKPGYLFSVKGRGRKQHIGKNGVMIPGRDISPIGRDGKIYHDQKFP